MPVLRYFAAIRAEAGVSEQQLAAATLADALASARAGRSPRFAEVLGICSFVVDGDPVGARDHTAVVLGPTSTVDCLPPFAGG